MPRGLPWPLCLALLVFAAAVVTPGCAGPQPASVAPERRPNVLLIAIDDLRPELSCLGSTWVRTPQLDRLAASGVAFAGHMAAVPTCGASRYAWLTGRSPARSGVTGGNQALYAGPAALPRDAGAAVRSLPERLRRAGWRTECLGKISHTPDGRVFAYDGSGDGRAELPGAWDALPTPFGPWSRGWGAFFGYAGGRHREDGSGYAPLTEWLATSDGQLPDGLIAQAAAARLAALAQEDAPFLLAVGFSKPHLPWVATAGDRAAVDDWPVTPPASPGRGPTGYGHGSGEFLRYDAPWSTVVDMDAADQLAARRAYAACVRFVDRQVGRVLDALDDAGLAEDTIVVLWSDHGWHLGESALWGKHTPLERALRSPLIVRAPGVSRAGVVSEALVESVDVYPTLVELCGLEPAPLHAPLDGTSLVPLLTGAAPSVRDDALSAWGDVWSLRTATHRLIARRRDDGSFIDVELFALADGPDPARDVAPAEPRLAEDLLARLAARLDVPAGVPAEGGGPLRGRGRPGR